MRFIKFLSSRIGYSKTQVFFLALLTVFSLPMFGQYLIDKLDSLESNRDQTGFHYTGVVHRVPDKIEEISEYLLGTRKFSMEESRKLATIIVMESEKNDLDPFLVLAVVKVESHFRPSVVSNKGAVGLMQVMPSTGRFVAKQTGEQFNGISSLYDPPTNLKLGISYLAMLRDRFQTIEGALVAYNFGPNSSIFNRRNLAERPPYYVRQVLEAKSQFETRFENI